MPKPKIAIVNSSSFGKHFPQHLERLKSMAEVARIDVPIDIETKALAAELQGIHGIIASVTPFFPRAVLERTPELVLIARHGIGCDNVDLEAASSLGILVSRVEGVIEREAVAEHAVTLLLSVGRFIHRGYNSVRESRWQDRALYLGIELRNKRIGLLGIGNIGSRVAEILTLGFHAEVVACDPFLTNEEIRRRHAAPLSLNELLASSDVVSFHCPVNKHTKRMLNRDTFRTMKAGAILINTCRGELLDEDALVDSLRSGHLRAYGADVVEGEPIDGEHRLLSIPNVLIVPHLAGYTDESLFGMGETMVQDVINVFVARKPPGILANPEVIEREYRRWP